MHPADHRLITSARQVKKRVPADHRGESLVELHLLPSKRESSGVPEAGFERWRQHRFGTIQHPPHDAPGRPGKWRWAAPATPEIEKTLLSHDSALQDVIQKMRPLLLPPPDPPKPRIGFHREEDKS